MFIFKKQMPIAFIFQVNIIVLLYIQVTYCSDSLSRFLFLSRR